MSALERNFFTDPELFQDPTPYYRALLEQGRVFREPHLGVFALSRANDIMATASDAEHFSAIVSSLGPMVPLPRPEPGESWAEVIDRRRAEIPMGDQLVALDPPRHTRERTLAGRLFTPNRLKENEAFMEKLAGELVDEFADRGEAELGRDYARPFTLLVIADLLGVPEEDHEQFRTWLGGAAANIGNAEGEHGGDRVFANLAPYFQRYIEARRAEPQDDVLGRLAVAKYHDGELPEADSVVRLASILFAAGQETTARLITAGMRVLAECPDVASALRADPSGIPNFVEECLRLEGPIKTIFRLALADTEVAGVEIPAGSIVMGSIGAANRDPELFADPERFDPARPNARRNIAFGHGEHFCPGASLARAEARVSFERLLARLDEIEIVEPEKLEYAPTFIIRGLNALPLRFRSRS